MLYEERLRDIQQNPNPAAEDVRFLVDEVERLDQAIRIAKTYIIVGHTEDALQTLKEAINGSKNT